MKEFKPKDFSGLIGTPGFSEELLSVHFKLYEGYVTNTNNAAKTLENKAKNGEFDYEFGEIRRRFGWEFNGMRLHEYYFGRMTNGGSELAKDSTLANKIDDRFGSFDAWKKDFEKTGGMRGIGWAALVYDAASDQLFNTWLDEHDTGNLAGCEPILLLDVFEHAFMRDYGKDKASYMDAYFKAVDWETVVKETEGVLENRAATTVMH